MSDKPIVTDGDEIQIYAKNRGIVARARRGISQNQLARHMGVQTQVIKQIERGDVTPDEHFVTGMSFFLNWPRGFFYEEDFEDNPLDFATSLDF